jgi:hypothetical protein
MTRDKATIGRILKNNGYWTSWFGKDHNTPEFQASQAGPFDQWPTGMGFDYFYGFVGGDANQWQPNLFRNTTAIYPYVNNPRWNLITAEADDAIEYLRRITAINSDQPFFVYYVPGAVHAPHHPTPEWIKRISEMHLFDKGWNELRETIFANQKRLGVIPQDAKLTLIFGRRDPASHAGGCRRCFVRLFRVDIADQAADRGGELGAHGWFLSDIADGLVTGFDATGFGIGTDEDEAVAQGGDHALVGIPGLVTSFSTSRPLSPSLRSILSADRNVRNGVLAALREIYDGRWQRNVGVDGGRTLTWTGRLTVVGACTSASWAVSGVTQGDACSCHPVRSFSGWLSSTWLASTHSLFRPGYGW